MDRDQIVRESWYLVDHNGEQVVARCVGELWVGWEHQPMQLTDMMVFQTVEGRLIAVEADEVLEATRPGTT